MVIFGKILSLSRNINIETLYFLHHVGCGDTRKCSIATNKNRNCYVSNQNILHNCYHANKPFSLHFEKRGENISRLDKWFWSVSNDFWFWVAKKGGLQ